MRQLRFVKNYEQSRELAKGKFEVLGHLAGHVVDSELDYLEVWLVALEKETIVVARHAAEIFLGMDSFVAVDKWPRIVVG